MVTRRPTPILVFALLMLAAGLYHVARPARLGASVKELDPGAAVPTQRSGERLESPADRQLPTLVPGRPAAGPVATLGEDSSALLAEMIALRQLGEAAHLSLPDEHWAVIARVTAHLQAVRLAYEASIATLVDVKPGYYRLDVPPYARVGADLRAQLQTELRIRLGTHVADYLQQRMATQLDRHFAGFGVRPQTFEFRADVQGQENEYSVTRREWSLPSQPAERPALYRTDAYLPGFEDPSGFVWGPFLTKIAQSLDAAERRG